MTSTITLVAIVKNEGRYLDEWLSYYRKIGISKVICYDNGSTDGTRDVLNAWSSDGWVEVVDWPTVIGVQPQKAAYNDAKARVKTRWAAFFDADEFLVLHAHTSVPSMLDDLDPSVVAVCVNWRVFGSSGETAYRPQPMYERFVRAAEPDFEPNRLFKTIARTDALLKMSVHHGRFRRRTLEQAYRSPSGGEVVFHGNGLTDGPHWSVAQLNHYVVKSAEEWADKRKRGRVHNPLNDDDKYKSDETAARYFKVHDRNETVDRSLLDMLARIEKTATTAQ
ncbi:MAG: glycosyltransferase family 92 protein [Pseudomonadota bacterium]